MGPVGSGKSFAGLAEIMLRAVRQAPSPVDGIRYSRWAVIRNTYPELRTTTIKTWQELFPETIWGPMRWSPPITHHIQLPPRGDAAGIDCEVIFLALDTPQNTRRLLSLELTGGVIDEARELPKAVVDALTARVGRYPTRAHGGCAWRGCWMMTNPPDSDHWWHNLAEKNPVGGKYPWHFYRQPGGIIEVDGLHPDAIEAVGRHWAENTKAENTNNLPAGYYQQALAGKNLDWVQAYLQGQYTYVQDGKPVWPEFNDIAMTDENMEPVPGEPVHIGMDFGLTPAAVIGQKLANNRWIILDEMVSEDMGLERFGHQLVRLLNTKYQRKQIFVWGDPAGVKRDEIFEVTAFEFLRTLGLRAQPTVSNDFKVRREAGALPMTRFIEGRPGLLVDKRCARLRKSLAGGYHFKRIAVGAGYERFRDVPNKDMHSHVGDAYGYLMLGGGEHRRLVRSYEQGRKAPAQIIATMDFDPLA